MGFEIINKIKKEKGLTNAQISSMSGVTLSTLDKITSGVNTNPKLDTLQSICRVLGCTLNDFTEPPISTKKAPPYSDEAVKLAEDYDRLDSHGQRVVRIVTDEEKARMASELEQRFTDAHSARRTFFVVPEYRRPMSAGTGQEAGSEAPENMYLKREPPRGTSYIAPVSGDSMEPTYSDGDRLFIRACNSINVGQIGVFFMEGEQWIKELGNEELLSHNPKYLPIPMTDDIRCQGLVLGVCDKSYFE